MLVAVGIRRTWPNGHTAPVRSCTWGPDTDLAGGRPGPSGADHRCRALHAARLQSGLREADVYLGWFGPATRALHLSSRIAPALRQLPGAGSLVRRLGSWPPVD